MPPFKQLSDTEIAAVITYTRNAWGNKTGESCSRPKSRPRASKRQDKLHGAACMCTITRHDHARSRPRRPRAPPDGIMRWITTTNHKDIGTLYLWFSFVDVLVGGVHGAGASAPSCSSPACRSSNPEFFNQLTTLHGADHGVRRDHAGVRRLRELADPDDDRRARHGVRAA